MQNWFVYIYYKAQIMQEIYDCVSTQWASRFLWLKINISPKYIISRMLIFLSNEIGIFSNFLNTLGAGSSPKHKHMNS